MILIVDDKKENLFSLKTLLELNRYEVDMAQSGEEALKKILKTEYALIILDVQMPGMDGFEVAETISSFSKSRNIPIIFLSAVNIDKRFVSKGYASGGADYVTKPFDPDLLLLKVKTFHRLYEQTRELKEIQSALKDEIEIRKEAEKALQNSNVLLEDKVRERTSELLKMNKELEVSNAELQQYASLASHDLQEPLRKIITFTNLVQDRFLSNNKDAEPYMQKVIASTERMRSLINDLLNYSKLSAEPQFVNTDLNEIIQETISDLELSIKEKNASIIVDKLPVVEAIPGQMRQVFQNILGNALKFSKPEVTPEIKIWSEPITKTFNTDDRVNIFISDNGIGFSEAYVDKIFTIFQRLHARSEYEGTGIGLAIVKKIVEKHNGTIVAQSREGEGSTFTISLPVKQIAGHSQPVMEE